MNNREGTCGCGGRVRNGNGLVHLARLPLLGSCRASAGGVARLTAALQKVTVD